MNRRTQVFARALVLRCPNCGARGALRHWFAMRTSCPSCGLSFATGNSVGAYILNLFAAESLLMVAFVTVVVRTWPDPPWDLLQWLAPLLMLVAPLVFYPFAKMAFVALDLAMHPQAAPDRLVHGVD